MTTTQAKPGYNKAYAQQWLSREGRLDLLAQLKSGKVSAYEALNKAGFRLPRVTIRIDNPRSTARTLFNAATPEFLAELERLLGERRKEN